MREKPGENEEDACLGANEKQDLTVGEVEEVSDARAATSLLNFDSHRGFGSKQRVEIFNKWNSS